MPAQPRPQDARTGLNNILRAHRSGLAESKIASAEPIRANCAYLITEKILLPRLLGDKRRRVRCPDAAGRQAHT